MALVINNAFLPTYLNEKMRVTNGTTVEYTDGSQVAFSVITYPATTDFPSGAILILVKKPFCDFAQSKGGKGAMTAAHIMEKYSGVPEAVANTLAADFAVAYGNYVIIPDTVSIAITVPPINSIFDLLIPENPSGN
jgi:hypothetical protein